MRPAPASKTASRTASSASARDEDDELAIHARGFSSTRAIQAARLRVILTEPLELAQDRVERLVVVGVVVERVLEERKRRAVSGRELAVEVVPAVEQTLEQVEGAGHLTPERCDPLLIGMGLPAQRFDLVRWALPDSVEPLEEDLQLGAPRRLDGEEARFGPEAPPGTAGSRSSRGRHGLRRPGQARATGR